MDGRNRRHLNGGNQAHSDRPESRILRFNDLCHWSAKLAEEGSITEDSYRFAMSALDEAIGKVVEGGRLYQIEGSDANDGLESAATKGSPKRMNAAAEKRKRATYTCSSCKMTGHNASTCPEVGYIWMLNQKLE